MPPAWQLDPLADRWVIQAPARAARPDRVRSTGGDGDITPHVPAGDTHGPGRGCPFCPGNEDATPPELDRRDDRDGGWKVRVFPNLFPAVVAPAEDPPHPLPGMAATGAHEVIVSTPRHDASFADLDDEGARAAIGMILQRIRHHEETGRAYVQAFVNHGASAGASIDHPHAQLVALDTVPPRIAAEVQALAHAPCVLCDAAEPVQQRGPVYAAVPPWAVAPLETLLAPAYHGTPLHDVADDLAVLLRDVLRAVRSLRGDVAHNVVVHAGTPGPVGHPHVHVHPRTTTPGGFELATGVMINPTAPATSAARLRSALSAT